MLECVVNVSEGRDPAVIDARRRGRRPSAARRPHRPRPPPHRPDAGRRGRARGRGHGPRWPRSTCARHDGVHPRIGAVDVVPFVPLAGIDARRRRRRPGPVLPLGGPTSSALPCFRYGPERTLPEVRRGAFTDLAPDCGPTRAAPVGRRLRGRRPTDARRLQRLARRARPRRGEAHRGRRCAARRCGRSASTSAAGRRCR